ncbi:MAG: AraC family transcriptional regulator [Brevundimonas sp.]|jgi:AraC family transcriptional regulator|uniref:helix-turn-helix domain-containing protein n=1 Tax=Brevundimonas sp. TaxID=1871086 RepID=UPI0025690F37|nr:AraC family transcriptional regulator [Brevundimonas sp.]MDK2747129.1 AraC family transcriptional regulator [Brevundimonas sp.]
MARPHLSSGDFFGAASRTVQAGGFRVGLWIASRPPEGVEQHAHDDAHFVLALDDGYRSLAHDPLTPRGAAFGPGALVWNPPGVEHRDCFDVAGGRFLSISFDPPKGAGQGDPLRLRGLRAENAARRLVGVAGRFAAGDAVVMEGLTLDLAAAVLSPVELNEDPAPEWLLRAHQVMHDLADQPGLEVATVAEMVGVHPVSLARRYRRHFGRSPSAAIRAVRADRAAAQVARGRDLAELALGAGYADQSHLTREFGAIYGLTPARYRALFA